MRKNTLVASVALTLFVLRSAVALAPEERFFFGLTALAAAHPEVDGTGFSFAVSDTEFDLTHPALGWVSAETYAQWYNTASNIPGLPAKNPRIFSAANRSYCAADYTNRHHGGPLYSFSLPIENANTLKGAIWGVHGTAVAGTAGSGTNGPEGRSLGVAPRARLVFASDTEDFKLSAGQVADGNPQKTVAINRSFTGSSWLPTETRMNSGLVTVNAAGNDFGGSYQMKTFVYGVSPHFSSVRWLVEKGYDLVASGLGTVNSNDASTSAYGSQRNQETIWTDFSISTLSPGGQMDAYWSGTSFASPFTVGGVTLVQQAYANSHTGRWLRVDQLSRILRKSARFVDDIYSGLRYPVADFNAAVTQAIAYNGDPSLEPNFTTDFSDTNRVNTAPTGDPCYPNPNYFRADFAYGGGTYDFTAPTVSDNTLRVQGNVWPGECNIALRNGWGDLAVVDLAQPGKKVNVSFDFDTNPGWISGTTETYIGVKEMVGSEQFMSADRQQDSESIGRLAFRITSFKGTDNCAVQALRCYELPDTNDVLWIRNPSWTVPPWGAPLASAIVTNLTMGNLPTVTVEFTATHMRFLRGGVEILNVEHGAPSFVLARSTPYLHFKHTDADHLTRVRNFRVQTTSSADPVVSLIPRRLRALEGLPGSAPAASAVLGIRRSFTTNTPLTVSYTVSGSASNGVDFAALSGSLTIPANVAEADLVIQPLPNDPIEPDESVVIHLASGAGYALGGATSATVTLADLSDADADGVVNTNEDINANGNLLDEDTDQDLLADYVDADDDGDRVPTIEETANGDTDGDTLPDYLDMDDDGDGLTTLQEDRNRNGNPRDDDYDGDLTPDYLDPDPAPYSDYIYMNVAGTFNNWATTAHPLALVSNRLWRGDVYIPNSSGASFKFVAEQGWTANWGDNAQSDSTLPILDFADPSGADIAIGGALNGTYRFTFNDATLEYTVEFVPPTDLDTDGMADDWERAHSLNPDDADDADDDPDLDGFTNLQEFQNGTDPFVWDPRLTTLGSLSVAATFNGWNAGANNMRLVNDYVWRFVGAFRDETNVQFKFAANGTWTTNWGDNNQSDFLPPVTGTGDSFGANIVVSNALNGLYAFTFNETSLAYSVEATYDEFSELTTGITQIVSLGVPGPIMGASPWKAIAGGDEDTVTPSGFVLARTFGLGRVVAFGHDGIIQQLDELDNRAFLVNVMKWLNNSGGKKVVYTEGHGEWVQGAQLAALQAEMAGRGYTFSSVTGQVTAAALAGADIAIVGNAWQYINYSEQVELQNFVNGGGGLLVMGLGWSWPGAYYDDYPMNTLGEFFQLRWLRGYITDPTHQHNGSAVFHTFYPFVPYDHYESATGRIAAAHAAHPADLPAALESDARLRFDYLVAQGALGAMSRDFYQYGYERYLLYEFCMGQVQAFPQYFSKTNVFSPVAQPVMSRMRERFMRTWTDAQGLWDPYKGQIATAGGFYGTYSNIWRDFTVYLMDNNSLDSTQRLGIASCLSAIPPALHNMRAISALDFIGNTTPSVALDGRDGQVNIFGLKVGAMSENPFPLDVAARTSDVFHAATVHELNHVVDAFTVNNNSNYSARKSQLIAAAGTNRFHYLRGGDGLEFLDHGFFSANPQEFYASIANQWFTDSEQVFELGYARFTNGIPHPVNQALFFADVYSRNGPTTWFYAMNGQGQLTGKTARLVRTVNGFIRAVSSDQVTWFFDLDGSGNVTNIVKTDGTADQDGDGMSDSWEIYYDLDPLNASDAALDADADHLTNLQEFTAGASPRRADTDLDGVIDILDDQPLTAAHPQATLNASSVGTAIKSTYRWTYYFISYGAATWGSPSYSDSEGFAKFDLTGIPDHAVIRNVSMLYAGQSYAYFYLPGGAQTLAVALEDTDPAQPANVTNVYETIRTGSVLQAVSGTNGFPFSTWRENVVDWEPAVEGNLASRLAANAWSLGFRAGTNNYFNASISNLVLVVSYETNGPYATAYNTMTMAGTLNGWNPAANNMVLVSNHTWQFIGDVRNAGGVQIKFAADRSWAANWGDNDQADFEPGISGTADSSGGNITINGILDGALRVRFNELTGAYSIEVLPRPDSDGDGMPDDWERYHQLNPALDDAGGNPDGDLYSNLEEYQNGTDPRVYDPPNSGYSSMSIAGTFNNWDTMSQNMSLVSNFTWRFDLPVTNLISLQFKIAANSGWEFNWGDNDQPQLVPPVSGVAERDGANLQVNGPLDGALRFTFYESSAAYTVERLPPLDTDGDGMPDYWEDQYALDKGTPDDADDDPDADGFNNLREYQVRSNPRVPDAMNSTYTNMSVAADFNGWNAGANNMKLVDHYTWRYAVGIDRPSGISFKFAAEGSWALNWGDNDAPPSATEPLEGIAEASGADIHVDGPLNGTYVFIFNESTRSYRFSRSTVADFDQDGITDDWESSNGFDPRDGADAGGDADGDGLTNLDEFESTTDPHNADTDGDGASDLNEVIAGTGASDPNSLLKASCARTGTVLRVTWPGASGRGYNILRRQNLLSGGWDPEPGKTNLPGRAGWMAEEVPVATSTPAFFMIQVWKNIP